MLLAGLLVGVALGLLVAPVMAGGSVGPAAQQCPVSVQSIKEKGRLVMATSADWPPYEYVEGGQVVGIDVEIARAIAERLGVRLEVRDMKFAGLIEAVRRGEVDVVLADMAITPERERVVLFSIPYQVDPSTVIASAASPIHSVEDLRGKKVGVQVGTVQEAWADRTLGNTSQVVRYDKVYPYMVEALRRGDVDAIVVGGMVGKALTQRFTDLKAVATVGVRYSAVAMPPCAQDLKLLVDSVIYDMLQAGKVDAIISRWIERWLYGT